MKLGRILSDRPKRPGAWSLGLNALFLSLVLAFYVLRHASNDDGTLAMLAAGLEEDRALLPFMNIAMSWLIQGAYDLFGKQIPWFSVLEYLTMFSGFTALCYVLFRRWPTVAALAGTGIILMTFGLDAYVIVSYTKVAAVGTVGGLVLMLDLALERERERERERKRAAAGLVLALVGFMWRPSESLAVAALLSPVGLYALARLWQREKPWGSFIWPAFSLARPFLILLSLMAGATVLDRCIWTKYEPEWTAFRPYQLELMDYNGGARHYPDMSQVYDELGLGPGTAALLAGWDYLDTQILDLDTFQAAAQIRDRELGGRHSLGDCLRLLVTQAPGKFRTMVACQGSLLALALWIAAGRHSRRELAALGLSMAVFAGVYLYFFSISRTYVEHVDMGLFFALAAVPLLLMDGERPQRPAFAGMVLALAAAAVLLGGWAHRGQVKLVADQDAIAEKAQIRAAVELICQDEEHLYLSKISAVDAAVYAPFDLLPGNVMDRLVYLGGWQAYLGPVTRTLDRNGISNPYEDMIDNDRVLLIDDALEPTLLHIRAYYAPDARAELVEPLSTETGLSIYRILSH